MGNNASIVNNGKDWAVLLLNTIMNRPILKAKATYPKSKIKRSGYSSIDSSVNPFLHSLTIQ